MAEEAQHVVEEAQQKSKTELVSAKMALKKSENEASNFKVIMADKSSSK